MTSSVSKPMRCEAHWFQTLTRPSRSIPKIGAFAVSISQAYSRSCAMRAVMSWPMPTTPTTVPCSSRRVVALSRIWTRVPCFVCRGKPKFAVSTPSRAFMKTSWTDSL